MLKTDRFRTLVLASALGIVPMVTGCASLQDVSAGQVGCPASEIRILDDHRSHSTRTWVAQCRGRSYQCSASGRSLSCAADEPAATAVDVARASAPEVPTAPSVERLTVHEDGRDIVVLRTHFRVESFRLTFAVAPIDRPSRAFMTISAAAAWLADGCRAGMILDGQVLPLTALRTPIAADQREYRFDIDLALLRQLATATRVAGRVCETEWRLAEREQTALRELLARVDEETAWAAAQTSGGESTSP